MIAESLLSPINLAGVSTDTIDSDQFLARGDHRFGANDRIFARYVIVSAFLKTVPLDKVSQITTVPRAQNLAIGYSKIITPTILNDFRYGYNRQVDDTLGLHTNTDFTHRDLGLDFRVVPDGNRTLTPERKGCLTLGSPVSQESRSQIPLAVSTYSRFMSFPTA